MKFAIGSIILSGGAVGLAGGTIIGGAEIGIPPLEMLSGMVSSSVSLLTITVTIVAILHRREIYAILALIPLAISHLYYAMAVLLTTSALSEHPIAIYITSRISYDQYLGSILDEIGIAFAVYYIAWNRRLPHAKEETIQKKDAIQEKSPAEKTVLG
jgi:hypothetical protein